MWSSISLLLFDRNVELTSGAQSIQIDTVKEEARHAFISRCWWYYRGGKLNWDGSGNSKFPTKTMNNYIR